MTTLRCAAILCGLMLFKSAWADDSAAKVVAISDPLHPGMLGWKIDFTKPADQKDVYITLRYKFWNPKIDGDVPSKQTLNLVRYQNAPPELVFKVFVSRLGSVIAMGGPVSKGDGCPLDDRFAVVKEPNRNPDGVYVLCQKPVDPANPAAPGDTQEAAAWVELGLASKL